MLNSNPWSEISYEEIFKTLQDETVSWKSVFSFLHFNRRASFKLIQMILFHEESRTKLGFIFLNILYYLLVGFELDYLISLTRKMEIQQRNSSYDNYSNSNCKSCLKLTDGAKKR